jgi:hypothetical protein
MLKPFGNFSLISCFYMNDIPPAGLDTRLMPHLLYTINYHVIGIGELDIGDYLHRGLPRESRLTHMIDITAYTNLQTASGPFQHPPVIPWSHSRGVSSGT